MVAHVRRRRARQPVGSHCDDRAAARAIRYRPDATLFKSCDMRAEFLPVCGRTRDLAAFHPHVRFTLDNEDDGQRRDFHYPAGLLSLAQELEYQGWNGFGFHGLRPASGTAD